jgi:hypothetical protein
MPPAATMVPPIGFVMVSLNVVGADDAPPLTTGPNIAPHVLAAFIVVRPAGAQSPVNPVQTYPLSGSVPSSTGSPVVIVVEHCEPPLPHLMPGPLIVPPVGFVIVRIWPAGQIHRIPMNSIHTSNAPTATVPIAIAVPRVAGVAHGDSPDRGRVVDGCARLSPFPCNRSLSDCKAAPKENDDFERDAVARDFG